MCEQCCGDHIDLAVEGARAGARQPVPVEPLEGGLFRVLHSPGFVEGVAAGDVIRLIDDAGNFDVVERGGNLSIKVFSQGSIDSILQALDAAHVPLGGTCDGSIPRACVFTISATARVSVIARTVDSVVKRFEGAEWYFGNAHGADGVTPLEWCREFA